MRSGQLETEQGKKFQDHLLEKPRPIPKKTYVPCGHLVALHLLPARPLVGGLILPQVAKGQIGGTHEAQRCLVIAAGPDCKWVKEGDEVLCVNGASLIVHDGQETVLIKEDHLAGIVIKEGVTLEFEADGKRKG